MIIIQVEGGLGNQMFQYALGLSFVSRGITVKLDISKFEKQQSHNGFELDTVFAVAPLYCSGMERTLVKAYSKLRNKIQDTPYKEKADWQWNYHPDVNKLRSGYLKGYWQCEKYFSPAASLVKQQFRFPALADEVNISMLKKIKDCNSVSIHIRRGDYLSPGISASIGTAYYNEAIQYISSKITSPVFFIFSDDIEWAKKNIQAAEKEFISWNKGSNSYIDMLLMSHCKHNIIANSSFSWWGAWLNNNTEKMVIAPDPWMPAHSTEKDIIPEKWILLPAAFVNNI
jgi:Glycosyl transferase family 11